MLWSTLFRKIGKQPLKFTQHNNVYVITQNKEKINVELAYDTQGHPYLIQKKSDGVSPSGRNIKDT